VDSGVVSPVSKKPGKVPGWDFWLRHVVCRAPKCEGPGATSICGDRTPLHTAEKDENGNKEEVRAADEASAALALLGVALEGAFEDDFEGGLYLDILTRGEGSGELFAFEGEELFLEDIEQRGVFARG
jgi:hypothetical protein